MIDKESLALSCYSQVGFNKPIREKSSLRVYISYHPDDFSLVKTVADMILKKHNCTVYFFDYQQYQSFKEETLKDLLSEMHLVIFLVTPNYLNNPGNSFDNEYPFFKDEMFPMLPILCDPSLLSKYESVFGDIQCIRWIDNIEARLNEEFETLISVNQMDKSYQFDLNDVFKKRLFLSYRRVDKAHALKVIKQIHSDPHNQDIAIWYDDFLIPGLDYDVNILDEIKEADLCIFLITPHILEGDNYVKTIEYVKAREINKIILPLVIEDTDYALLKEQFPGIGVPAGLVEVSDHLKDFYQKQTIYDEDPETIFQVGVAYLQGAGVEHNTEIALKLLEAAAKKSNKVKRFLAEMYLSGKRVVKDFKKYLEISLDLIYNSLNYDYEKLNEDDQFFLGSIPSIIDVLLLTYGHDKEYEQFSNFVNDALTKFNFEKGSDGYYLHIATQIFWTITNCGISDFSVTEQLYPLGLELFDRDLYFCKEMSLYTLVLHNYNSVVSTGRIDKDALNKIKILGEQLLHMNPLRFCKISSLTVILQTLGNFPYEEAMDFCDSLISFIDSFTTYRSELEPIKKILYVERTYVLIRYDFNTFINNSDKFLEEYRIDDPIFIQTNTVVSEYYQKLLYIFSMMSKHDLVIENGEALISYYKKYEGLVPTNSGIDITTASALNYIIVACINKGDFDAASKYLRQFQDLDVDLPYVFVTNDFGTIYSSEILIHIHNGDLDTAKECLDKYKEMIIANAEKSNAYTILFTHYINSCLTYQMAVDPNGSLDDLILENEQLISANIEDEDLKLFLLKMLAIPIFNLLENNLNISHDLLFHFLDVLKKTCEIPDDPAEKRAYLLDAIAMTSYKKYEFLSKEERYKIKMWKYYLIKDFVEKYPQFINDTVMTHYCRSFAEIYRDLYYTNNQKASFNFYQRICDTCHALFNKLQDKEGINYHWFDAYVMAFSLCATLNEDFDFSVYKEDIAKIKEKTTIDYDSVFDIERFEIEQDHKYRVHVFIAIALADFVFLRSEELLIQDHLEITKWSLDNGLDECFVFHPAIKDLVSKFTISDQLKEYFSLVELLNYLVEGIENEKSPDKYPFKEYTLSYKYTYSLVDSYIWYLDNKKIDDLYLRHFYFLYLKVILNGCSNEVSTFIEDPNLEEILHHLNLFAFSLAKLDEKYDAPVDEIKQFYLTAASVSGYVIALKPTYTKAQELYCDNLCSLFSVLYKHKAYKEWLDIYRDEYLKVIGNTRLKTNDQFYILCMFYYIFEINGLEQEKMKKLIRDCYEQWEYVMDQDFYKADFLSDRFDDFMQYDPENARLYDSLKKIFCQEEIDLDAYDVAVAYYIAYNKAEQAMYLCQKEMKKLSDIGASDEQLVMAYANMAKTYQLMGDENKFEEYKLLVKQLK